MKLIEGNKYRTPKKPSGRNNTMERDDVLEAQMEDKRLEATNKEHFRLLLRDMRQFKRYGFDRLHRSWLYLAYLMGRTAEIETRL